MSQPRPNTAAEKGRKRREFNVYALLFFILIIATLLTYILPAGEYTRVEMNGRNVVQPGTYHGVEQAPVSLMGFISAIHTGLVESSDIIFFVLIIGGVFGILNATGAVESLIVTISRKLQNREKWLIPIMMLFFALGGSLMGMAEETLAYIGIMIPLALALGFDVITGTAIVLVGASVGFTTAVMNPFNVGVAQGISELPMFSGIGYRIALFVIMYVVAVWFVTRYAMKVKRDHSLGFFVDGNVDTSMMANPDLKMETKHKWIIGVFLVNFGVLAYGVIQYGWYITEIAGLFTLVGVIIGIIGRLNPNEVVNSFLKGAASLISGALIIGFARAIVVVLSNGQVIDTILFYTSSLLENLPPTLSAVGMLILQAFISFIVPSGSGQAALTMPIMSSLADLIGVTRQTAVLCFTLADGIGNIILPTSGYFMAGLAIAGIPWTRWVKWILPLILIQYAIAIVAVILAQMFQYGPF